MARKKNEDKNGPIKTRIVPNKGNYYSGLALSKLTPEIIDSGTIESFQSDEDAAVELANGWIEMCLIFLGLYHYNHENRFIKQLIENKIINQDFEITAMPSVKYKGNKEITYSRIGNTNFWFYSDLRGSSILPQLKKIAISLGIDPKRIKCNIKPYTTIQQDIELMTGDAVVRNVKYRLSDTVDVDINNNKIKSITIIKSRTECKIYDEAIIALLCWTYEMYPDRWFERVTKYNKENTLRIDVSEESAEVLGCKVRQIGETGYFFSKNINANDIATYMREICAEFGLASDLVTLEFSLLDIISHIKT